MHTAPQTTTITLPAAYVAAIEPFAKVAGITVDQYVADILEPEFDEVQNGELVHPNSIFNIADLMLSYAQTTAEEERLRRRFHKLCRRIISERETATA